VRKLDFNQRKIAKIHDFSMDFDLMSTRLQNLKEKYPSGLIIPIIGNDLKNPEFAKIK
jgi:hypothetical protein